MEIAIANSVVSNNDYQLKKTFNNFETLLNVIKSEVYNKWTVFIRDNCVVFGYLITKPAPSLQFSITVDINLQLSIFKENRELNNLAGIIQKL